MDQFEDEYDLQRCGSCGRRFERRAALAAHSQICHKRSQIPGQSQSQQQSTAPAASKSSPEKSGKKEASAKKEETVAPPAPAPAPAPTPLPPLLPIIHANFNALKENQRSPSLPANALFHPAHLSHLEQVKNEVPSKKIEIQVRMDYGKGNNVTPEYRARTPSMCRSDEGVTSSASLGKSEDASASSDNNGESSDASGTHKSERLSRLPKSDDSRTPSSTKVKKPADSRAGNPQNRYPVRKTCLVAVNVNGVGGMKRKLVKMPVSKSIPPFQPRKVAVDGFSDLTPAKSSDGDCSEDESGARDVKRNKLRDSESPFTVESEGEDEQEQKCARQSTVLENEAKMAAITNIRKLICLTCKKKYKTVGNLRRHVATHIGWFRFRCMACDFKCFDKYDCVNHALSTHLEAWEKHKAMAFVVDMQLESGGSHDPLSSESVADSADSEATSSDIVASSSPDKESGNEASAGDNGASSDESCDRTPAEPAAETPAETPAEACEGAQQSASASSAGARTPSVRTPPSETAIQATN